MIYHLIPDKDGKVRYWGPRRSPWRIIINKLKWWFR